MHCLLNFAQKVVVECRSCSNLIMSSQVGSLFHVSKWGSAVICFVFYITFLFVLRISSKHSIGSVVAFLFSKAKVAYLHLSFFFFIFSF